MYLSVSIFYYLPTRVLEQRPVSINLFSFCSSCYPSEDSFSCRMNFFLPKSSTSVTILGCFFLGLGQSMDQYCIGAIIQDLQQDQQYIRGMLKSVFGPLSFHMSRNLKFGFGILKFNLPDLGEKIKEGTIKKLYVKEGDKVNQFQKLADVASDKQFTEITASDAGVIRKIHHKEEDVCQVGQLFLEIEVTDSKSDSHQAIEIPVAGQVTEKAKPAQQAQNVAQNNASSDILATPYVRGLIKQRKLDISKIKGTGPNGRILQSDLNKVEEKKKPEVKTETKPEKPEAVVQKQWASRLVKMSNFEKGMQKSMTESNKIPHLYLHQQFDITQTEKMRKTIKNSDIKVTLMGILIKTFSLALKRYPIMNATYEPDRNQFEYTIHGSHNISIAIDSPNGLVVPNIKNVQDCNLVKIQSQIERLRTLSSQGRLTSKELGQGTVCLSNIGTVGGIHTCPLILPPQVCIVGIGKMQTVPKYLKEHLVPRTILTVSYGCDHRVIDGATVAKFSNEWKKILENPYLALAEMN